MSGRAAPQRPRDHLIHPGAFGHSIDAEWRQPSSVDWLVFLRHAEIQHAFVARLRRLMRETPGLTQAAIARGTTIRPSPDEPRAAEFYGYKRLNDGINGHKRMTLVDMQRIEVMSGPILLGLQVRRVEIEDSVLREEYPLAVGGSGSPRARQADAGSVAGEVDRRHP